MASYFAKFEKEYQEKMEKQSATAHRSGTNTRTNDDNKEEEALSESTFIDPDEQEIMAAIRRDQEEARIEYKKEQTQRSAALAREEAAHNAAMAPGTTIGPTKQVLQIWDYWWCSFLWSFSFLSL